MEAKHTQGPLKAVRNSSFWELVTPWPDETLEEANANSPTAAYVWGDTEEQAAANARRLSACWNACAGIPTEALEDGSARAERDELREMTGGTFYEIKKQRDELLAALEAMNRAYLLLMENGRDRIIDLGGECDPLDVMERSDPALRESRAVIASVKGGAA